LLGGGGTGIIGHAQYTELEAKLEAEVTKIEERNDSDYEIIMEMSRTLVRIETKVDALKE
jgi:hypothetical protein